MEHLPFWKLSFPEEEWFVGKFFRYPLRAEPPSPGSWNDWHKLTACPANLSEFNICWHEEQISPAASGFSSGLWSLSDIPALGLLLQPHSSAGGKVHVTVCPLLQCSQLASFEEPFLSGRGKRSMASCAGLCQTCLYQACDLPAVMVLTFPWDMAECVPKLVKSRKQGWRWSSRVGT